MKWCLSIYLFDIYFIYLRSLARRVCLFGCMYTHVYMCVFIYIYTHLCIFKRTHTHTHTRAISVPIPKTKPPNPLDALRPILLIPIPCKILERIIAKELWKIFAPQLDHRQFVEGDPTRKWPSCATSPPAYVLPRSTEVLI